MTSSTRKLLDDCFLHDKDRLPHEEAITLLRERLSPIAQSQITDLQSSNGMILASDVIASRNVPSTDNSAVDGYAYNSEDYDQCGGYFPVISRIAAGDIGEVEIPENAATRIFTGAVLPKGVDTIAMQEDCEPHEQDGSAFVAIPPGLKKGANLRLLGEDLKSGEPITIAGDRLTPQNIAAIASTGINEVSVFTPLKVAIISSGNELIEPGNRTEPGQVYDSNRHLLKALCQNLPIEITDLGIQPDNYQIIENKISNAAITHDIIISSGGASRGDEDHITLALENLGKRHLWQLAVKPGRPMSFGQIGDTAFFGLPGNPVACFVCFLLYVRPAIMRLNGSHWQEPRRYKIPALFDFENKKPDRREFWRGIVKQDHALHNGLEKFARDGSGLITGLRTSDGLIEIPEAITKISKGDMLNFIPWSEFGL